MPDPVSAAVETPSQATPSTPAAAPATPSAPAAPSSASPAVAQGAAPSPPPGSGAAAPSSPDAGGTPPSGASQQPSWLQQLRQGGADFGADEGSALRNIQQLYADVQRMRPLAPHVAAYMQHAPAFTKYLQAQQAPQQPAAGAPPTDSPWHAKYWKAPEYNPAWEKSLIRDGAGNIMLAPGTSPDIVAKMQAYRSYVDEQVGKFTQNPYEYMAPAIEDRATAIATRIVEERLARQQDTTSSKQFVAENQSWLYDVDPQSGQPRQASTFNPSTGQYQVQPALSQWGQAFAHYVQGEDAKQRSRGYVDVEEQKRNAMALVQRDYAVQQLRLQQSGGVSPAAMAPPNGKTPQQLANEAFLANNNPPGGVQRGNSVPLPEVPVTKQNLVDMLRQNFRAGGITDEVLQNENR